jgi:hypothetical protein
MKKFILLFILNLLIFSARANTLSDSLRISLLTVSPGSELYSVFGHSGIRVIDLENKYDVVFNYGMFDFKTDWFYIKFALGRLDYMLCVEDFNYFMKSNIDEQRTVIEQELNMSKQNKVYMISILLENYKPENRSYRYKFFTDNCATRIRDIFAFSINEPLAFRKPAIAADSTFRYLFTSYLTNMPWARFGIELVLGKMTDKKAGYDAMFLPDVLMQTVSRVKDHGKDIVLSEKTIYKSSQKAEENSWFSPLVLAIIILVLVISVQFSSTLIPVFDKVYFIFFGILGLFILTLSIFSAHEELHWNFVVLLLLPTNLLLPFLKNGSIRRAIAGVGFTITALTILLAFLLPQTFNSAVFLLGIATAIRLFFNFVPLKLKK